LIANLIRFILVTALLGNVMFIVTQGLKPENNMNRMFLDHGLTIFSLIAAIALTFLPSWLERRKYLYLPYGFQVLIILFVFAALYLGDVRRFYYRFVWWDKALHFMSGLLLAMIGFLLINTLNKSRSIEFMLTPFFVALFSFNFALSMGVVWEIYEFAQDVLFGTATQSWDIPVETFFYGHPHQGAGLLDTMGDLICGALGALTASVTAGLYLRGGRRFVASDGRESGFINRLFSWLYSNPGRTEEQPEQQSGLSIKVGDEIVELGGIKKDVEVLSVGKRDADC